MAHGTKTYLVCLLLFALSLVHTTIGICPQLSWDMRITNGLQSDALVVYPTDKDGADLGPHNLNPNEYFSWEFCEHATKSSHWYTLFYWQPHQQNYTVWDNKIGKECFRHYGAEECYWLVKEDGFFVSPDNDPFPKGWVKKYDW
ncbi:putative plant self-incompatibility S1 [Helianthus annuus]|nr:putative plant self-incompatibility S1 [Helianthus annuus]